MVDISPEDGIQTIFRHLAQDDARTETIANDIADACEAGRKILVLTERTDHLKAIQAALSGMAPPPFVLHGRMSQKQRAELMAGLDALAHDQPRILLATGKLVGEGFDYPPSIPWYLPCRSHGKAPCNIRRKAAPRA
ncbi:hypothetical protein [Halomonas sp. LBP4]|uniref:hypothetical protein n=1 Tax=Halomonas sp. LBP4 TaxID=2044917 RepID=UPI001C648DD2|nr:hypothetical protein [Halomonas sp. LBP4]